jgi:hypothetical protein
VLEISPGWYEERSEALKYCWCPQYNNAGIQWFWIAKIVAIYNKVTRKIYTFNYDYFSEG